MDRTNRSTAGIVVLSLLVVCIALAVPELAIAQASPFETGATNLVTSVIAIATPVVILLVMGLGFAAAAGQISWAWAIGFVIGVCLVFAAQPIVTWIRGLFGV